MNHKRFYISEAGQAEIVSFGHYGYYMPSFHDSY